MLECTECKSRELVDTGNELVCKQCGLINEITVEYVGSYSNPNRPLFKSCYIRSKGFLKLLKKEGLEINEANFLLDIFLKIENRWNGLKHEFNRKYFLNLRFLLHSLSWMFLGIRLSDKPPLKDCSRVKSQAEILEYLLE